MADGTACTSVLSSADWGKTPHGHTATKSGVLVGYFTMLSVLRFYSAKKVSRRTLFFFQLNGVKMIQND
jgi:hypothetical protein